METILEQQRRYHEEKERLMDAKTKEMLQKKSTLRDQINSDHRIRAMLDRYMDVSANLRDSYEDKDGMRKDELAAISGPNEFAEFYNRLKHIKEFHRKHPNEISIPMSAEFDELMKASENLSEEAQNMVEFTDEEGYGRYLDLHDCYLKYINLKGSEKLDYITYLSCFDQLFDISKDRKNAEYRKYLEMLLEYLQDYTERVKPLLDQNDLYGKVLTDFEKKWDNGTFPGWPKETSSALTHAGAHLDLSAFSSWEELASLGLDRLKSALMALELKCGGTLEERAQRLFSTKGKSLESLDPSLFAKNPKAKGPKKDTERNKEIAFLEAQVYELVEILGVKRATEAESAPGLGWKGKSHPTHSLMTSTPIPYWLYKLHGLNINYNCEICGNYTYRGPKAFQRHFAEWRHAHGMRCLGIPNTAHFANVTQIEDAVSLWAKLKSQKALERWQPDTEEEYEDSSGNVVNKKTYEDLKRQGLL
uniref:Splicing factor 3a, subunit 3 n=1 Tax=Oryzias sinensis TaxID=183150 RepID=A0A8C7XJI0_9TELE